jgi:hypothetical protein
MAWITAWRSTDLQAVQFFLEFFGTAFGDGDGRHCKSWGKNEAAARSSGGGRSQ